ncbi:MAG: hypothetical protein Q9184_006211, partial [Pyrenodesmia sp. 2 TL-2023]
MKVVNVIPPCYISSAYGNALGDETLEDIATAFLGIDAEFIGVLEIGLNDGISGRVTLDTDMLSNIKAQVGDVMSGRQRFHEHYLRQRPMLLIWQRASHALLHTLDLKHYVPGHQELMYAIDTIIRNIERLATPLNDLLSAAAIKSVLDREDRAIIRLRMLQLDEMLDIYHHRMSST